VFAANDLSAIQVVRTAGELGLRVPDDLSVTGFDGVDLPWLDPVLSLLVALYILYEAIQLVRHSLRDVLDEQLPETIRQEVEQLIRAHHEHLLDFHNLRTRRAGSQKIMDFHLTVCKHLSVEEAHNITDYIEKKIGEHISGTDVTIHVEPCRRHDCPGREACKTQSVRHAKEDQGEWWKNDQQENRQDN